MSGKRLTFKPSPEKVRELSKTLTYKEIGELLDCSAKMIYYMLHPKIYKDMYTKQNRKKSKKGHSGLD